jgi:hypothetical protein
MDKENVVSIYNGAMKIENYVICRKMGGTRGHYVDKISQAQKAKFGMISLMWNLDLKLW